MRSKYIGLLLLSYLLINTLFVSCTGSGSGSGNGAYGNSPDNAVPMGKSLIVSVPWESANAELSVLEVNERTDTARTERKILTVKLNLGATGKSGGTFPYFTHEFSIVGSKGTLYDTSSLFTEEILSGHSTIKEIRFSGIDQVDSNFLLVFHVHSLSGREDKVNYFSLETDAGSSTTSAKTSIAWGKKVSPEFKAKVNSVATNLQVDVDHLMAIMAFETGESFSPSIKNPASSAIGLIQFLPSTATNLNTSTEALSRMSAVEQLAYVEEYFLPYKGTLQSLEDTYMAVLWPKAIGKGNNSVLFSKPTAEYTQNRGLDLNSDGNITKDEASDKVRDTLTKGLEVQNKG